jgi:hypothetical protein
MGCGFRSHHQREGLRDYFEGFSRQLGKVEERRVIPTSQYVGLGLEIAGEFARN